MTEEETGVVLSVISQIWRNAPTSSKALLDIWTELLEDLSFNSVKQTIKMLALTGKPYPPTISEIRQSTLSMTKKKINSGLEAYNAVRKVAENIFFYANGTWEAEGYDELQPIEKKVLDCIGVHNFVDGDPKFSRSQFIKLYEQESSRFTADELLPLSFRNEIEAGREGSQPAIDSGRERVYNAVKELADGKKM